MVIIPVDHVCSLNPPWAIVRVIIVTCSIVAEAEFEAVVTSVQTAAVPGPAIAAVSLLLLTLRVSVTVSTYLQCVRTHHWGKLQSKYKQIIFKVAL